MPKCAGCGKAIRENYINALKSAWHPGCFTCVVCGKAIEGNQFAVHKNRPLHAACYTRKLAKTCHGCQAPIVDRSVEALGGSWHPHCFICAGCRHPIESRKFLVKENRPFHEACYLERFMSKCGVCGKPLTGAYLKNFWGDVYCGLHPKSSPACISCERLISERLTGGGHRFPDGVMVCSLCFPEAVTRQDQVDVILPGVAARLASLGISLPRTVDFPVLLTDKPNLVKHSKRREKDRALGVTLTELAKSGKRIVGGNLKGVLILHGLRREHFETVLVHELCHVWLFLGGLHGLPQMVEEGICTLGEYLWLRDLGTENARFRLKGLQESKDPIYGKGFQKAVKAHARLGLPKLLAFVKAHKRFPSWYDFGA